MQATGRPTVKLRRRPLLQTQRRVKYSSLQSDVFEMQRIVYSLNGEADYTNKPWILLWNEFRHNFGDTQAVTMYNTWLSLETCGVFGRVELRHSESYRAIGIYERAVYHSEWHSQHRLRRLVALAVDT